MENVLKLAGRTISRGVAEGEALVSRKPFSFMGSAINLATGVVMIGGHDLEGQSVKNKIVVYDSDYMSTSGAFGLLNLATIYECAPKGIIWREAHNISASAAIFSGIPGIDRIKQGPPWEFIETGDWVRMDGNTGIIEVRKKRG